MKSSGKMYYLAAALALIAVLITVIRDGFTSNEYLHVGFMTVLVALMVWLGRREGTKLIK
jgi:hypothetical protein